MTSGRGWAILASVSVVWLAGWAEAQSSSAQVILARAPAEVVPRGQSAPQPLAKGARLAEGDRVRTGKGGAAEILLGDGSLVRLGELSDLEIDRLDVDPSGAPVTSRFNLQSGQARAWVARQLVAKVATGVGRFAVQTPTAVAAVRQTDFAVAQSATTGIAKVYTFAGLVQSEGRPPATQFEVCGRNRFTQIEPRREPAPCRIIPLRERNDVLRALAFEAAHLNPGNPDYAALNVIDGKLIGEKMAGDWAFGGGTVFNPPSSQPPAVGTASVTVIVK